MIMSSKEPLIPSGLLERRRRGAARAMQKLFLKLLEAVIKTATGNQMNIRTTRGTCVMTGTRTGTCASPAERIVQGLRCCSPPAGTGA